MEACAKGTVISTNRLWWLKINKKPIRTHLLDGADFPTVITVQYSVSGVNYKKRKFIGVGTSCPKEGEELSVFYLMDNPKKARIKL